MDACEEPLFANTANLERSDQVPCACSVTPACGSGFSIFGDSISTLQGYIPKGWRVHYEGEVSVPGVVHVHETWWGRVVDHFQGHLVANASFSGSVVEGFGFPAGNSDERVRALVGATGEIPEVGCHPSSLGMRQIADMVIAQMEGRGAGDVPPSVSGAPRARRTCDRCHCAGCVNDESVPSRWTIVCAGRE